MTPFVIHGYVMLVIGLLELGLLWHVLTKYQRTPSIAWFAVVVGGVAAFVLTNAVTYFSREVNVFFHQSQWFAGVVLTAAFYLLAQYFPFRQERAGSSEHLTFWTPVLLFFVIIYLTGQFITGLDPSYLPARQTYGPNVWVFVTFFFWYWAVTIATLIRKLRVADGIHRWQLKTFLFGAILPPLALATVFDVILPLTGGFRHYWLGIETTIIWLVFTMYIMVKKA